MTQSQGRGGEGNGPSRSLSPIPSKPPRGFGLKSAPWGPRAASRRSPSLGRVQRRFWVPALPTLSIRLQGSLCVDPERPTRRRRHPLPRGKGCQDAKLIPSTTEEYSSRLITLLHVDDFDGTITPCGGSAVE